MAPRVAIVSGAAGGLGGPIVARLEEDGFAVAGFDAEVDVSDPSAVRAYMTEIDRELGPPTVLVTAAGVQRTGPSEAVTEADWSLVIDVNLTGTWNAIQAVLPGMLERGSGRIITISSEVGLGGLPGYAAYAASKGGVIALTKALARELAPRGICVNSVAPGPLAAGMFLQGPAHNDEWLAANVPIGRVGRPSEIAAVVALLAGDEGGYFVGQVLSPNGGTVI